MTVAYSKLSHPLRTPLSAEMHSRPSLRLQAPEVITHMAVFARQDAHIGGDNLLTQHVILAGLCRHFGVAAPASDSKYFFYDFGKFRLKWECHTEFASYTFVVNRGADEAPASDLNSGFAATALRYLPQQWLFELQGKLMVACHLLLLPADYPELQLSELQQLFEANTLIGSQVLGRGEIWMDFQTQADGFSRFVVLDRGFLGQQAGRTVQRLLEIETYRMMALLGLPYAQKTMAQLNELESDLVTLTSAVNLMPIQQEGDADTEQHLLKQIIALAVKLEKLGLENNFRFSASEAYYKLVQDRIVELREYRIEGLPTVQEFMQRRLAPAMNTCAAIRARLDALAARVTHTNDLLRTRVGILQEQQNRKILHSMNHRAAQQLRLQQAVEGLSVAAISYYVVGLISYGSKALKSLGLNLNVELVTGLAIPLVLTTVWLGLRRLHHTLSK